jgi:excisionase family DNA binding protein
MVTLINKDLDAKVPTDEEIALAKQAAPQLADLLGKSKKIEIRIGANDVPLLLPASSLRLLADILAQIGSGNAVTVLPVETELTTQQAADILNVSRPYLVKLLEEGTLPHRSVGTRQRVLLCDVLTYKQATANARAKVLEELTAQAQELKMGY